MTNLTILNTQVRNLDNLYALNDLRAISGNDPKHRPSLFARTEQVKELINVIENERSTKTIFALKTIRGGADITKQGTWACKELVIAYAAWISPAFHLVVLRAFLNQLEQPKQLALPEPEPSFVLNVTRDNLAKLVATWGRFTMMSQHAQHLIHQLQPIVTPNLTQGLQNDIYACNVNIKATQEFIEQCYEILKQAQPPKRKSYAQRPALKYDC